MRGQDLKPRADGTSHPMVAVFEEVLRRARSRRSRPDEASALADLGRSILQTGDPQRALPYLQSALPMFRELADSEREGLTLELVSLCYRALGDVPHALETVEQSLHIAEQAGNKELCAARQYVIGTLYAQQRQPEAASPYFRKAAELAEAVQLDNWLGPSLLRLGETYTERGLNQESIPFYQKAIEVFSRTGDQVQEQLTRAHLGMDLAIVEQEPMVTPQGSNKRRMPGAGLKMMLASGEALIQMQQWFHVPVLADNIGQLLMNHGEHGRAAEWFEKGLYGLDLCGGMLPVPGRGRLLHRLAMAAHLAGDHTRARENYQKSLPLLLEEGAMREHAISQGNLGTLLLDAGQKDKGMALIQAAAETASRLGDDQLFGAAMANLGLCHFHAGRKQEALPLLQQALEPLRRCGDSRTLGLVLQALNQLRAMRVVEDMPAGPPRIVN